eukprot:8607256-Pyramimonas_sp.AAC.1
MAPKSRRRLQPVEADGGSDDEPGASSAPAPEFSNLSTHLLKAWSWGLTPAAEVQRVAAAAHRDGLRHKEVERLASFGQWGHYPGNVHGQLTTMLGRNELPQAYKFKIPFVDLKSTEVSITDCSVLLPHEWFSVLFHKYPAEFEHMFGVDRIAYFWDNASR